MENALPRPGKDELRGVASHGGEPCYAQVQVVQKLLEMCRFVKVKRLFMYMAEKHRHPWVEKLDLSRIDFGKGKAEDRIRGRTRSQVPDHGHQRSERRNSLKKDTVFFRQAELLLRVLPFVNEEKIFALKGGTAINFFFRDLPRLSIDIDLTYLPINDRETALTDIEKALHSNLGKGGGNNSRCPCIFQEGP